jgi:hypothetical protein
VLVSPKDNSLDSTQPKKENSLFWQITTQDVVDYLV